MEETDSNSRVASLLAYHLVNLVLQEGCMIANAALESGHPREYLAMGVNAVRSDLTYVIRRGEDTAEGNFIEGTDNAKLESELNNILMTSTPQKNADDKPKIENGQGDDHKQVKQQELNISTSLFINHLFDISELELGISENANHTQNIEYNDFPFSISNVMDCYMNAALDAIRVTEEKEKESVDKQVRISGNSSFTYVEGVFENYEKEEVLYVDHDNSPRTENVYEIPQDPMTSQMALQCDLDSKNENSELYENTYLTLNRDYDQCSDEEEFPILADPKGMLLQEIALMTANTSFDTERSCNEHEEDIQNDEKYRRENFATTSGVSSGSRKSRIVRRWRMQGAKFLACIRGWWRRKSTGKRKEGASTLQRPLSPGARRRACSLLDQRVSPAELPRRAKCNTINEALLNSHHWMDYTFDTKRTDCGDV
ncbi:uncharacterized protein LOC125237438 isoform X1 [Leguminivora glycinivorella]|uniref:uncharacterized protein LOC125237438 isoform X1 n=1 Tax=Leguminivora glycinivorella TaxID=1035111 RepID=UPI00200C7269|nr:uncharacterized protein LOC125237438 isoform X1 [Leguminivora glycinivorella]XP_048000474.1 uncharacterized protein LOC125237438 isoform X1 [Leguminivora glycinivorella]